MGGKAFRIKTLRLMHGECTIIDRACVALHRLDRSSLMCEAALLQAGELGQVPGIASRTPSPGPWPYLPARGQEPTDVRVAISMSLTIEELTARSARHVNVSVPLFLIGSTLAYIGRLQRCFTGEELATPEEAAKVVGALRAIRLSAQYQYRRGAREKASPSRVGGRESVPRSA